MALSPDRIVALKAVADALAGASHGTKQALAEQHAHGLNCDVTTLYRQLREAGFGTARKQRSDAGKCSVSRDEAMVVIALKSSARRANGKDNMALGNAADLARQNGLAALGRVDTQTGEVVSVSDSTIGRALRQYGLSLKALKRPAPHIAQASLHPNHVWQIDASVCVLYYLDGGGLTVMEKDEFYKNKPENFEKKIKAMVIRYVCADHYSGAIHFRYYLGAESSEMLCDFFFDCIQPKGHEKEPFNGVPFIVSLDPGSANKSHTFKNLARMMGMRVIVHKPKNPRAKGSVEKHNDLIERGFESRLIAARITSLEQLNEHATQWRRWFNGTRIHSRHKHTRYGLWQTIRREHLRLAPDMAVCRALLSSTPLARRVNGDLTVNFDGAQYLVKDIPHLNIGQQVFVARNPYLEKSVLVIEQDEHGKDVHWVCPMQEKNDAGFVIGAPVIGENFKSLADTPAVRDMKAIERLAYGVEGKLEVDAARKKRQPVFGGLDITGYLEDETPASYMPRKGTESDVASPVKTASGSTLSLPQSISIEARRLSHIQLAGLLHGRVPGWNAEKYAQLTRWYPDGATDDELEAIAARFNEMPKLAMVAGGG